MLNLNNLENGNYLGFSYTNSNSKITLKIFDKVEDSLVVYCDDIDEIEIQVTENGVAEFAEVYKEVSISKLVKRSIIVDGKLSHHLIYLSEIKTNSSSINCCVNGNGEYTQVTLDFNDGDAKFDHKVSLNNEYTKASLLCASVVENDNDKNISNTIINEQHNTIGLMENFGVSFDTGKLVITGVGDIKNGAYKSVSKQKSTMFVMDEKSRATSQPLLCIAEDDVEASHASAVGQINEDTIFYLCSRGIKKEVARKLVVMGYFKPFIDKIVNKDIVELIENYLNEVINNV